VGRYLGLVFGAKEGFIVTAIRPEIVEEVLQLMIRDGVTLSDDLNQCERAILAWVRKTGAAMLESHLAGKKTDTKVPLGLAPVGQRSNGSSTTVPKSSRP